MELKIIYKYLHLSSLVCEMDFKERDFENESISKLLSYKFEQNPIMTPAKGFENNFASKSDSKSDVTINENRIKRLGKDLK